MTVEQIEIMLYDDGFVCRKIIGEKEMAVFDHSFAKCVERAKGWLRPEWNKPMGNC